MMFEDFIKEQGQIENGGTEQQLQVQAKQGVVIQLFEKSFTIHANNQQQTNKTNFDLMGCSIHDQSLAYFYTLQGIVSWDLEKNQQSNIIPSEEIFSGDCGPRNEICTAHEKTIMTWDFRLLKPVNIILAHSLQITSCKFNETAQYIVTSAQDNYSRVFQSYFPECLQSISMSKVEHTIHAMFTKDSKHILVSTLNNPLSLWHWSDSKLLAQYQNELIKNNKFYLEPQIKYENQMPKYIIQSGQDGVLGMYDFAKPTRKPKLQQYTIKLTILRVFIDAPVRFTCDEDYLYAFQPKLSQLRVFKFL